MNILFVYSIYDLKSSAKPLRTAEEMQFGISYISSLLKEQGHSTKLVILSRMLGRTNKRIINKAIQNFSPQVICFTAVSSEYRFIADMAGYVKANHPQIYLLAGGTHTSLKPEEVIVDSFDGLCRGEGEYATLELVKQIERGILPSNISNLWIKHKDKIEKNPLRPFLNELDSLPFPDRKMWEEWIEADEDISHSVLLGRGCPFECTYCCNHALKRIASGNYVRFRSTDNILAEIRQLTSQYPKKKYIYLEVETIGADKQWALELCSRLQDFNATLRKPLSFGINLRLTPNLDYEELFAAFRKSNFKDINIGLESGSERIRREIFRRNYSNENIINAVQLARKYDLQINFYNLIGVPGETIDDFKETVKINRICLPDKTYTHIFFPYPGTELYSLCKEQGLLKKTIDTKLERCKAILDLPGFSRRQIQKAFILFDYYVYRGYRPMRKILTKVFVAGFRSNFCLHYLYRKLTQWTFLRRLRYSLLSEN